LLGGKFAATMQVEQNGAARPYGKPARERGPASEVSQDLVEHRACLTVTRQVGTPHERCLVVGVETTLCEIRGTDDHQSTPGRRLIVGENVDLRMKTDSRPLLMGNVELTSPVDRSKELAEPLKRSAAVVDPNRYDTASPTAGEGPQWLIQMLDA
jgi:hypothetical protein